MSNIDLHQCNEEYWADRQAERQPMNKAGDFRTVENWSSSLAKKVFADAEEIGIPDSDIDAMKGRMREWHKACVAYHRDRREVMRDCKDPRELAEILATMRANQDDERERIFG